MRWIYRRRGGVLQAALLFCCCGVYLVHGGGRFVREPTNPLEVLEGEKAQFNWDYVLDGDTTIAFGKWGRLNADGTFENPLIMNQLSSQPLPQVVAANVVFSLRTVMFDKAGMEIRNTNLTDQGGYRCALSLSDGHEIASSVQLVVLVRPVINSRSQPTVTVEEGQNFTLPCGASVGNPRPFTFFWKLNGVLSATEVHDSAFNLLVVNASRLKKGDYECTASNKAGTDTYTVSVIVNYKPVITTAPENKEIKEGSGTNMFCVADGFPTPVTYSWYSDSALTIPVTDSGNFQVVENGQRLTFTNVQASMTGTYYCVAVNVKGRGLAAGGLLNVTFAPRNVSIPSTGGVIDVLEGTNATISCHVDANPPAFYTWSKDGLAVHSSWTGELILYKATKVNRGVYLCSASNKLGALTGEVTVDVKYAPKDTKLMANGSVNQYVGIKGNPINMTCSADGNPSPTYSIRLAGHTVDISTEPGFYYIAVAGEQHEGTYDCFASNSILPIGTSSLLVILAGGCDTYVCHSPIIIFFSS